VGDWWRTSGSAVYAAAQGTATGVLANGGPTGGTGVFATGGTGSGRAITALGGTPNGQGLSAQGQGSGAGVWASGGGSSGPGVFASAGSPNGTGVQTFGQGTGAGLYAQSLTGLGGSFFGGRAPINLAPATAAGPPTTGAHNTGDVWVDGIGMVWICTLTGTPGTFAPLQPGGSQQSLLHRRQHRPIPAEQQRRDYLDFDGQFRNHRDRCHAPLGHLHARV